VHLDTQLCDARLQNERTGIVHPRGQEPWRALYDMRFQAEAAEHLCHLEPVSAATHDDASTATPRVAANDIQIGRPRIDEAT